MCLKTLNFPFEFRVHFSEFFRIGHDLVQAGALHHARFHRRCSLQRRRSVRWDAHLLPEGLERLIVLQLEVLFIDVAQGLNELFHDDFDVLTVGVVLVGFQRFLGIHFKMTTQLN